MRIILFLTCVLIVSCSTTEKPLRTTIIIKNDGSTVINEYKDSTTVVNLNKEGERIDK